uniref:Uncharacterized protein n=1 Tax=Timema tahoe TaxID=61484 RepID=A0A7R9IEJ5_9NEOP|nr:unnamed protein product [Timema tahoe]
MLPGKPGKVGQINLVSLKQLIILEYTQGKIGVTFDKRRLTTLEGRVRVLSVIPTQPNVSIRQRPFSETLSLTKMRCRLCELLTDQQLNVNLLNLQHNHHLTQQNVNVNASPNMLWLPPFRDMMLAYLLRVILLGLGGHVFMQENLNFETIKRLIVLSKTLQKESLLKDWEEGLTLTNREFSFCSTLWQGRTPHLLFLTLLFSTLRCAFRQEDSSKD